MMLVDILSSVFAKNSGKNLLHPRERKSAWSPAPYGEINRVSMHVQLPIILCASMAAGSVTRWITDPAKRDWTPRTSILNLG